MIEDIKTGPKEPRLSVLGKAEAAAIVTFRGNKRDPRTENPWPSARSSLSCVLSKGVGRGY